jgi:CRP-like cAMP-binding protein
MLLPGGLPMPLREKPDECFFYCPMTVNELLRGLDAESRETLTSLEEFRSIPPGATVFASGELPVNIYVHLLGKALLIPQTGPQNSLNPFPVGPNRIYGLIEALSGNPFEASLQTVTACQFGKIDQAKFLGFIRRRPALCFKLAKILSRSYPQAVQLINSH